MKISGQSISGPLWTAKACVGGRLSMDCSMERLPATPNGGGYHIATVPHVRNEGRPRVQSLFPTNDEGRHCFGSISHVGSLKSGTSRDGVRGLNSIGL
jgi:hypothetical protein